MDTMDIARPGERTEVQDIILADHRKLSMVRKMGVLRDEYLDYMTFKRNRRTLYREHLGPFVGLKEEWRSQGASDAELELSAFTYREPLTFDCGIFTGYFGPDQSEILSHSEHEIVYRNFMGIQHRLLRGSSTLGLPVEHPVSSWEDWQRIKPFYEFQPGRIPADLKQRCEAMRAQGYVITASIPGGFDEIRVLLGDEEVLVAPYTNPELVKDILDTIGNTSYQTLELATRAIVIDQLFVHEDMAGKSGPLWGPRQVEKFMVPYYRKCWDIVQQRGGRIFNVDSDGDCNAILGSLIRGGINMFHPCEPAANMDVVAIRAKYGAQLAFEGGINKYTLLEGKEAIERELERVVPAMVQSGGCMLSLDHRIPNGVTIENYRYYIRRLQEIIVREGG
jgi:hypothetical protein